MSPMFPFQAANYLDIKGLLDVTCKTVANMIKGKTPEEIRKTFNIKNDFTEEEEAQVDSSSPFHGSHSLLRAMSISFHNDRFTNMIINTHSSVWGGGRVTVWPALSVFLVTPPLLFLVHRYAKRTSGVKRSKWGRGILPTLPHWIGTVPANWLHWRCSYLSIFTFSVFRTT